MAPLSFLKQDKASSPPASPAATAESNSKDKASRTGGRLLRRKLSLSARLNSTSLDDADEPVTSASTAGSFAEKQQEVTELGRSLFSRQRRGSERSGWFSGGSGSGSGKKLEESTVLEQPTVVVLSASLAPTPAASRRITEDQNALTEQDRFEQQRGRPDTPPEAATSLFPTALSPPRRKPVPASPSLRNALQHEPVVPSHSLSALGIGPGRPASPASSSDGTGNAAWLARKPSLRSQREPKSPGNGVASGSRLGSPSPIARKRQTASSRVASSSSAGDADDDSDAELADPVVSPTPGYEVEIVCKTQDGEAGEMRWEVVIRPSACLPASTASLQHHHPVLISSNPTTTLVPPSASSLNMTLALDQPSGKLVFISLPSNSETPRRTRTTQAPDAPSTPPRTFASPASPMSSNTRRRGMYLPMRRETDSTPPGSPHDLFTPRSSHFEGGLFPKAELSRGESPNPDAMEHLRAE